jgi:MFS family permease
MSEPVTTEVASNQYTRLQWRILLIMAAMNFINYVDRQVVFPLFHVFAEEFNLTDFELGLLATSFMLVHSVALLPFGILADRFSRTRLVAYSAVVWSVATVLSGLAQSYHFLLGIRSVVGIGEAAYSPAATAIITDAFPEDQRARAQSYFAMGMFMGGTVGIILGGLLGEWVGWRAAFFLVGLPGFILAMLSFHTPDPAMAAPRPDYQVVPSLHFLAKIPAYLFVVLGGTLVTFASGSLITWGTEFAMRYYDFTLRRAAVTLALVVLSGGGLGLLAGGWAADLAERRWPWGRAVTVGVSVSLSAPILLLALYAPNGAVLGVALFAASFFLTVYHGPVTAIIHDLTPTKMHGFAFAAYVTVAHLFGDMAAPAVIGAVSDRYELRTGMLLAVAAVLVSGPCFLLAARAIRKVEGPKIEGLA